MLYNELNKSELRGCVFIADIGYNGECVQSGTRPVVIISSSLNNTNSNSVQVLPITSVNKKFIMHYPIHNTFLNSTSYVMCEQIKTISTDKLLHCIGRLNQNQMSIIGHMVKMQLDIT